ncbi:Pim proto-oncogene, serine/threonine kinase, related 128 [Danio rerio]|uniref:non-specific serine/threonine protein kinase n=1 Tax=Danio rerio TaxID=7955 RepID=A4QP30_DANRE|nr:Pim proto-oncogene, serine/threonine kinase, related 128 [Danio rerio]AAI39633.1 Si:ch211-10j20.1 protein [Danio rerio]|eukprot:NP_001082861.1 Pim proto-oncogene, serine/threonine kinase, related 128 [Danio rerio]
MLFTVLGVIALFLGKRNNNSTVSGQDERFDRQEGLVTVSSVTKSDGREIGDWCKESSLHLEEQINVQIEEPSLEEPVDGQSEEQPPVEPDSVPGEEQPLVEPDSVPGEEQPLVEPDSVPGEEQPLVEPDSVHGEEQSLVEPDSVHGEELSLVEPVDGHSEDLASSSSSSDDFPQDIYSAGSNCSSELTASSYSSFFSAESGCGDDPSTDFLSAESGCGDDHSTDFLSAESGCGDDPSTDFLSAESGCGDDPPPNVVSAEPGCSHDDPPNVVSAEPGCSHDDPPNVVSAEPGCSHYPPRNVVPAKPGCSHYPPPNVVPAKPGCKAVAKGATCQTKGAISPQPEELKDKDRHIIEINSKCYKIGAKLGKGSFGTVFATRLEDGLQVAVKMADFKIKRYIQVDDFDQPLPAEIALHFLATKGPKAKQIVKLLDWKVEADRYFLVLERPIPCVNLGEFLRQHKGRIPEKVLWKIMFHTTIAADICCKRGVLHRDIKPENLLINTRTYEVKLTDFGCGERLTLSFYTEFWGTPQYCPPEFNSTGLYYGEPATVWSLGILQYLLMFKKFPDYRDLQNLTFSYLKQYGWSKECSDFISCCMQTDYRFRYKLQTLRIHGWFKVMNTF